MSLPLRRPSGRLIATLVVMITTGAVLAPGARADTPLPSWQLRDTGSTVHFRGLAAVSSDVAWLGGYDGTVLRTVDGGETWRNVSPPIAVRLGLQFRDVSASDAQHAVAMSAGPHAQSRLFVTDDGGQTWRQSVKNTTSGAFFDCMSFSDARHGLVLSDPVDGRFRILSTSDGGRHWQVLPTAGMPAALPGEAAFAASGECLTTSGGDAWFGTGGAGTARVFHSGDRGLHWSVRRTPLPSGPSAGVNGLAFAGDHGVIVGGDFAAPTLARRVAAYASVRSPWRAAATSPSGYRSGVAFEAGTTSTVLAVGLTGSDVSTDAGRTWTTFDTGSFDTVDCAADGACWASGAGGRVGVLAG